MKMFRKEKCSNVRMFECSNVVVRAAFTLVELLVVIGIIGVLSGILFVSFGGATDSARATQCLTNMRALAMAANSYSVASNYYPLAGSIEKSSLLLGGSVNYRQQSGWISWLSDGNYDDGNGEAVAKSHQSNPLFPFYGTGKDEDRRYALENGALWRFCHANQSLYTCPAHVRARKKNGQSVPYFSYVMNAYFWWDTTKGAGSLSGQNIGIEYGQIPKADRILMFAELPISDAASGKEASSEPTGLKADSVLQYKTLSKMTDTAERFASEEGDAESIGFNHKDSKGNRVAHVAFADGHTESLVWRDGGLTEEDLTAYLCWGKDVVLDSQNGWMIPEGVDESADE